jgi:MoxR-like ATPase
VIIWLPKNKVLQGKIKKIQMIKKNHLKANFVCFIDEIFIANEKNQNITETIFFFTFTI